MKTVSINERSHPAQIWNSAPQLHNIPVISTEGATDPDHLLGLLRELGQVGRATAGWSSLPAPMLTRPDATPSSHGFVRQAWMSPSACRFI